MSQLIAECNWKSSVTVLQVQDASLPVFLQSHKMSKVGRDYWRSFSPNSPVQQHPLEYIIQDCVQRGFEYLQRRRLDNLSRQLYWLQKALYSLVYKVFYGKEMPLKDREIPDKRV